MIALMLLFESVDFDFPGLASRLTVCLKDSKTKVQSLFLDPCFGIFIFQAFGPGERGGSHSHMGAGYACDGYRSSS